MSKRLLWPVVLFAMAFGSGCTVTRNSLNVQRSVLRDAGDIGTTLVLENQEEVDVVGVGEGIVNICNDVLNFLDSGNINLLTKSELKVALLDVVPKESAGFVDDILSLVSVGNMDIQFIGKRNVKRIKALLIGMIRGANEYDVGDRE